MKIRLTAITDKGLERANNEDAFVLCPDLSHPDWSMSDTTSHLPLGRLGTLAVVADGMGGANAGDVASAMIIDFLKETITPDAVAPIVGNDAQIRQFLTDVTRRADERLKLHAFDHPETAGMGSTLVVCWLLPREGDPSVVDCHVAWCGDSRCYVYNPATGLRQLTKDHSYVQQLVDRGEITEAEAFNHPDSNLITRGLGDLDFDAVPDLSSHALQPGEWLLLCSDGLCGYCKDADILKAIGATYPDALATRRVLMQMALDAGGFDNITVAIASAIADDAAEPQCESTSSGGFLLRLKHFLLGD